MKFDSIDFKLLKTAINVFIDIAYPNGVKEKSFCHETIFALEKAGTRDDILNKFEKQKIVQEDSFEKNKYIIRLGSEKYPFMKLVLQETYKKGDFGFLVDRHTEYLALSNTAKSFEEEVEIKKYTKELKSNIEKKFAKIGIPTYREIIKKMTKELIHKINKAHINKNNIHILIVDDDEDILNLYKIQMEMLGYSVSTALNGEDGIYKLEHEFNDLMILDLMMPTISGFDVIKRVADEIPIIVVTALSDKMSKERCLKYGAFSVLVKPIDPVIVDHTIKKILNK